MVRIRRVFPWLLVSPLLALSILSLLSCLGCGGDDSAHAPDPTDPAAAGSSEETSAEPAALEPATSEPEESERTLVVFLGDSICAGLHLAPEDAFPAVLQRSLAAGGLPFRLVNAGVSGDTSAGGLRRIDWVLRQEPDVLVLARVDGWPVFVREGKILATTFHPELGHDPRIHAMMLELTG